MRKFVLEIEMGNAAMDSEADVADALAVVSTELLGAGLGPPVSGQVRDANGNRCGEWRFSEGPDAAMVHVEHEVWLRVCRLLEDAGAVTARDLRSSSQSDRTSGCALLRAIREWGSLRADLGGRP